MSLLKKLKIKIYQKQMKDTYTLGTKATWMTSSDYLVFIGILSRLIQDGINNGTDIRGKSYLDYIEDEIKKAA